MLKEIDLDELYNDTIELDIEICSDNLGDEDLSDISVSDIYDTIVSNINLQVSLADILLMNNKTESDSNIAFVYLAENEDEALLLDKILKIFHGIHRVNDESAHICAYQVYYPADAAVKAFHKAFADKKLNKWIYEFYRGDGIDDDQHISLFQYYGDTNRKLDIDLIKEDEFFHYMIFDNKYGAGLPVSHYKLEDIGKIPFINEIAALVTRLFLIVSVHNGPENREFNEKFLLWNRTRKDEPSHDIPSEDADVSEEQHGYDIKTESTGNI